MMSTQQIIKKLFNEDPIEKNIKSSDLIKKYYGLYEKLYPSNNSQNGNVFESLLLICLLRNNISPIYTQATLAFVPNAVFDIVLYNRKSPIIISAKTSLRERWKQADIEAMAVKYVHRKAKCFVLTLNHKEVNVRRKDFNSYVGIDEFVLADTEEFDLLIEDIKKINISESEKIEIIENHEIKMMTKEKFEEKYQVNIN